MWIPQSRSITFSSLLAPSLYFPFARLMISLSFILNPSPSGRPRFFRGIYSWYAGQYDLTRFSVEIRARISRAILRVLLSRILCLTMCYFGTCTHSIFRWLYGPLIIFFTFFFVNRYNALCMKYVAFPVAYFRLFEGVSLTVIFVRLQSVLLCINILSRTTSALFYVANDRNTPRSTICKC